MSDSYKFPVPPKVLDVEVAYDNKFIPVVKKLIQLSADPQDTIECYLVEKKPCAVIMIMNERGNLVMTEEYRSGVNRVTKAFPAGIIEDGEVPMIAAIRETLEETGYAPDQIEYLGYGGVSEGWTTEVAHYFFARVSGEAGEQKLDKDERIETLEVSVEAFIDMVRSNDISSNHTMACYTRYKLSSREGKWLC